MSINNIVIDNINLSQSFLPVHKTDDFIITRDLSFMWADGDKCQTLEEFSTGPFGHRRRALDMNDSGDHI